MNNQVVNKSIKVAISHDFFFQNGGAENVVEKLLDIYPQADVYTTLFIPSKFFSNPNLSKAWGENRIKTTFIQSAFVWKNGLLLKYFKHFFWLYPILMRFVCIKNYDCLIISSTDCAKQIRVKNIKKIVHYCHSPTRYLHGLTTEQDHRSLPFVLKLVIPMFKYFLRKMDLKAVKYLNSKGCIWIANSVFIQNLIRTIYDSNSIVIYPPVETQKYLSIKRHKIENDQNNFYLCHGRISFHKRLDIAILSCLELGRKLKISGVSGMESQMTELKNLVLEYERRNPSKIGMVEFLGRTTDAELERLVSTAKAFLFPGKEDFGIAPVEMLAGGVPLIAYKSGGALEYVEDGVNGVFCLEQNKDSFKFAILDFERIYDKDGFDENKIRQSSQPFDSSIFEAKIIKIINDGNKNS